MDTECALRDLQAIGVKFTQEYLDAVKQSEAARLAERRRKREQQLLNHLVETYADSDDRFAYIAGYTSGGAPYGLTWEDVGIDPELPYDVKVRLYLGEMSDSPFLNEW